MVISGTYWIWDGRGFVPRPLDRHHHDSYELIDGDVPEPDLAALAEVMAINPHAHAILAPDFRSWGRDEDGDRCWTDGWAGMYYPDLGAIMSLRWGQHARILAHELAHSVIPAILDDLDGHADEALAKWLRTLRHHGTPPGYPDDWWESTYEEPLCLSYDHWHVGREQPHGLALPGAVERIYNGIKSGKVWRRYMA